MSSEDTALPAAASEPVTGNSTAETDRLAEPEDDTASHDRSAREFVNQQRGKLRVVVMAASEAEPQISC